MKFSKGHVVAVTGAASGMGREMALQLAARGVGVAISDVATEGLEDTRRQIVEAGGRAEATRVDVADRAAVSAWADATAATFGVVHGIINNAGVGTGALAATVSDEDLDWTLGINLRGVIHGTQAFLPHLRRAGEGHIVNVSSVFGLVGIPAVTPYNVSKFAVRGYTECLAIELAVEGAPIQVTSVHPGGIRTNIARAARMAPDLVGTYMPNHDHGRRGFEKMLATPPEKAAAVILRGVDRNRRRVLIGIDAHLLDWMQRLFPVGYQHLLARAVRRRNARYQA